MIQPFHGLRHHWAWVNSFLLFVFFLEASRRVAGLIKHRLLVRLKLRWNTQHRGGLLGLVERLGASHVCIYPTAYVSYGFATILRICLVEALHSLRLVGTLSGFKAVQRPERDSFAHLHIGPWFAFRQFPIVSDRLIHFRELALLVPKERRFLFDIDEVNWWRQLRSEVSGTFVCANFFNLACNMLFCIRVHCWHVWNRWVHRSQINLDVPIIYRVWNSRYWLLSFTCHVWDVAMFILYQADDCLLGFCLLDFWWLHHPLRRWWNIE